MSLRAGTNIISGDGAFAFQIGDCLGFGKQGTVYDVKDNNIGLNDMVIKIIGGKQKSSQTLNHIEQLLTPQTKRIFYQIPSLECVIVTPFVSSDDKCCLLMPKAKGIVLETDDAWNEIRQLHLNQRLDLAYQIARGIEAIHQTGRIHADIAGPNIIVDKNLLRVFIIDIDGGGVVDSIPAIVAGHPGWMAPELEKTQNPDNVTLETDRWSLAVLLHHLIIGCLPFHFCPNVTDYSTYAHNWPPNPHDFDGEIKEWLLYQHRVLKNIGGLADLFKRCFGPGQKKTATRPTATEWVQHLSQLIKNKQLPTKLCSKCGHENKNELVYCENCLSVLYRALSKCSRCGGYKPVNAVFCPRCGAKG